MTGNSPREVAEWIYHTTIWVTPECLRANRKACRDLHHWTDAQVDECADILEGLIG